MKNFIPTTDNVLVEVHTTQTKIVLPDKKEKLGLLIQKVVVKKIGTTVHKTIPELKEGDEVLTEVKFHTKSDVTGIIGAKPEENKFFYVIKAFDIFGIVKK